MYKKATGHTEENWIQLENPAHQTKIANDLLIKLKEVEKKRVRVDLFMNDTHNTVISIREERYNALLKLVKTRERVVKYYKKLYKL